MYVTIIFFFQILNLSSCASENFHFIVRLFTQISFDIVSHFCILFVVPYFLVAHLDGSFLPLL